MSAKTLLLLLAVVLSPVALAEDLEWSKFLNTYSNYVYPHRKHFAHVLNQILLQPDIQLNSKCKRHVQMYADQLDNNTYDAILMFDSFSKPRAGVEIYLPYELGRHETCEKARLDGLPGKFYYLRVRHPLPSESELIEVFNSSNINSSWELKQPTIFVPGKLFPLLSGICIPSTCDFDDLNSTVSSKFMKEHFAPISFEVEKPYTNKDFGYTLARAVAKWVLLTICFVNAFSTVFNIRSSSFFGYFNMRTNLGVLLRPPHNPSTQFVAQWKAFYCVISNVSHLFIPISYEIYYQMGVPLYNALSSTAVRYTIVSVPTLIGFNFIITSSLSVFMWRMNKKDRKIGFLQFVLVRAFRSLPVILFMILFSLIMPDLGFNEGPQMDIWSANMSGNCYQNGLSELLFYSNFYLPPFMCSRTGWFVSSDMQLYIFSFLLVMFLCNSRIGYKTHKKVLNYSVAAATLFNFFFIYLNTPFVQKVLTVRREILIEDPFSLISLYFQTPQYILPYVIGMYLGYEMASGTQWPVSKAKFYSKILPPITFITMCLPYSLALELYSREFFALVFTIQRVIFIGGTAALFYALWSLQNLSETKATSLGYICTVFARFQFPWFLIHPLVISYVVMSLGLSYTSYSQILTVILPSEVVYTLILSVLVHLMVEVPFAFIFGAFLNKKPAERSQIANKEANGTTNYVKDE